MQIRYLPPPETWGTFSKTLIFSIPGQFLSAIFVTFMIILPNITPLWLSTHKRKKQLEMWGVFYCSEARLWSSENWSVLLKYFCINQRVFFNFRFIWISLYYGFAAFLNSFRAGIEFRRQNLMFLDVWFWRLHFLEEGGDWKCPRGNVWQGKVLPFLDNNHIVTSLGATEKINVIYENIKI